MTLAPFLEGVRRALALQPGPDPYPTPGTLYRFLNPHAVQTPALDLIDDHLLAVERGDITRLAVSIGPQEGKSERISRTFPLWWLRRHPDHRVLLASYQDEIAHRWGRAVRADILTHDGTEGTTDLGLRLRRDSKAVDRWQLEGHAGGMVTAGVGGSITGRPADLLLIDDPFKDKPAAHSRAVRETVRDFWRAVAVARLAPGAPVVIVHTRWHEDDLIGWLMKEHGPEWTYLNVPAVSEGGNDPLGRPPGVWMTSARGRTVQDWLKTRREVGEPDFLAMWQGHPNPLQGGLFSRNTFRYWQPTGDPWRVRVPGHAVEVRQGFRFATIDTASSTRTSADFTVCMVWCQALTGELILLDMWRGQEKPEVHWDHVRPLVERWDAKMYVEPGVYTTDLVYHAGREGFALDIVNPDKDKFTRALGAARRFRQGRVFFPPTAHWLPELIEELTEFPNGRHDDQVDAVAYASRVVSEQWLRDPGQTEQDTRPPAREDLPDPYATGDVDLERARF